MIGSNGIDKEGRADYRTNASRFNLAPGEDTLIVDLLWQDSGDVKITKRITLRRGDYLVDVDYLVENNSAERWQANLFGQIKRDSSPPPSAESSGMGIALPGRGNHPTPMIASQSLHLRTWQKSLSRHNYPVAGLP